MLAEASHYDALEQIAHHFDEDGADGCGQIGICVGDPTDRGGRVERAVQWLSIGLFDDAAGLLQNERGGHIVWMAGKI